MEVKNPSSYVKAGAGRGAGTILQSTDMSNLIAKEGLIMQRGLANAQKIAQLQQAAQKLDDAKWNALNITNEKLWRDADLDSYKIMRDNFEQSVIETRNKYGSWANVPDNKKQEVLKMFQELKDYAALSEEQKNIYKSQAIEYLKNPNNYDEKSKDLLYQYYTGGGGKSLKEKTEYRAQQNNLLIPKTFNWIKNATETIGDIPENRNGYVSETNVPELVSRSYAVFLNNDNIAKAVSADLNKNPVLKDKFANDPTSMPEVIQDAFVKGNPEWNYYLKVMYDQKYKKQELPLPKGDGDSTKKVAGLTVDNNPQEKYSKGIGWTRGGPTIKVKVDRTIKFPGAGLDYIGNLSGIFNPESGKIDKKTIHNIKGKIVEIMKLSGVEDEKAWLVNIEEPGYIEIVKDPKTGEEKKYVGRTVWVPWTSVKNALYNTAPYNKRYKSLGQELEDIMFNNYTPESNTQSTKPATKSAGSNAKSQSEIIINW